MFTTEYFAGSTQILSFLSFTLFLYWFWTRRHLYIFSLRYPGYWGLPFIGYFYKVRKIPNLVFSISESFKELDQHTFCIWMGMTPTLVTRDNQLIDKVLTRTNLKNRASVVTRAIRELIGDGLITSEDSRWQRNRKLLNPFFHQKILLSFVPIFNRTKDNLINIFKEFKINEEQNVLPIIRRCLAGTAMEVVIGRCQNSNISDLEAYIKNAIQLKDEVVMKMVANHLRVGGLLNYTKKAKSIFTKLINKHAERSLTNFPETSQPNTFLDYAVKLCATNQFTKNDLLNETQALVEVIYDSLSTSIFSTLVMLAMHPEVQQRLFEEIEIVLPDKNFDITHEYFEQMPYLNMVINETMRVIPPVPVITRALPEDIDFGNGWKLPKGLDIYISLFDLHLRKDIWGSEADKFNPDNFLSENFKQKPPSSYLPFSKGHRNCIGSRYAIYAFKIVTAALVRNFEFSTSFKYENLRFSANLTTKFIETPKLNIIKRK